MSVTETPVYDPSQGYVSYMADGSECGISVQIAGKIRAGIQYCNPQVEEAWRWFDTAVASVPKAPAEPREKLDLSELPPQRIMMELARRRMRIGISQFGRLEFTCLSGPIDSRLAVAIIEREADMLAYLRKYVEAPEVLAA